MTTSYVISPIEERWNQAVANPSIPLWSTIAQWAEDTANSLQQLNPDDIGVIAHRAIYHEARARMIAMQPTRETV